MKPTSSRIDRSGHKRLFQERAATGCKPGEAAPTDGAQRETGKGTLISAALNGAGKPPRQRKAIGRIRGRDLWKSFHFTRTAAVTSTSARP